MQNQEATLLERLQVRPSKFFWPLFIVGAVLTVLSAGLVAGSDFLTAHGLPIPFLLIRASELVGYGSAIVMAVSGITVDSTALTAFRALKSVKNG